MKFYYKKNYHKDYALKKILKLLTYQSTRSQLFLFAGFGNQPSDSSCGVQINKHSFYLHLYQVVKKKKFTSLFSSTYSLNHVHDSNARRTS